MINGWGIKDRGLDNLGRGRRAVPPTTEYRGRVFGHHRQQLAGGFQVSAEVGWISDYNFLEEYFEREWNNWKDFTTGVELKQYLGNSSWAVSADYNVNDFFTQTNNLPRGDHFLIGQSLIQDLFTWHAHTQVAYVQLRTGEFAPTLTDAGLPLPWETTDGLGVFTPAPPPDQYNQREGIKAATRHEIDLPLQAGPVKIVPYALGEVAYWQQDLSENELFRAYGQTGVRASMPLWKANPAVQNTLLNLNGLAHKVVFDAEFMWADASQNFDTLPLYEPLNDDANEHLQRRLFMTGRTWDLPLNEYARYDPRYYAVRSNMQGNVTAPSMEMADDTMAVRGGIRQRWQTKRGRPGEQRIVDWITLDVNATYFPEPKLDPFGEAADLDPYVGLVDYDFRWYVGDRVALLSDGYFDTFPGGLNTAAIGAQLTRPGRGMILFSYRWFDGPFRSDFINAAFKYRMSDRWVLGGGASLDPTDAGNVGQRIRLTRIGESFLWIVGASYNASRENFGFHIAVEPRFLARSRRISGVELPPAGAYGLE
jgi:hypothetical protein